MSKRSQEAIRTTLYQEVVAGGPHTKVALFLWEINSASMEGFGTAVYDLVIARFHPVHADWGGRDMTETFHHPIDPEMSVPDAIRLAIEVADHYKTYAAAPEWFGKAKGYEQEDEHE